MDHHPDLHASYYKTVKTSLNSIVTDPYVIKSLNSTVLMAHRITIHTLQFLKLYLLYSYQTTQELPLVNHDLIINIMKTLAPKQTQRGRPPKPQTAEMKEKLHIFFRSHYQPLMTAEDPPLSYKHMNQILEYMAITIETMYLNNIKQHFVTCVERYINLFFHKQVELEKIRKSNLPSNEQKAQITQLSRFLRDIKTDILDITKPQLSSNPKYHDLIWRIRAAILPNKNSYQQNSVYYDLQCHPEQYLRGMFLMILEMETHGASVMNLFPLRTSIIPKYIKIDTATLVHLLLDSQKHGYTKTHCMTKGNLVKMENQIWSLFFKTQKRCFYNEENRKYRFNYMIETDGVGCSIQLIRTDVFGRTHLHQSNITIQEKYIDEVPLEILQDKKLVAIDPNLSDLLYCVTKDNDQVVKLRYTQNQRRKETKSKKYLRLIESFKVNTLIEGQSVTWWETQFGQISIGGTNLSCKTLKFERFQEYIQQKNRINSKLLGVYETFIYRKLRWNSYINQQRSEARFLTRFKAIFGPPDQVVIGIGDYEQHQHRKFKEPVKGKGFRQMFRRAGYKNVYLVDEHKTSCKCYNCGDLVKGNEIVGGQCQKFRRCQNPRPWKKEEQILRHGLLMCQTCQKLWCRDTNAALNILGIIKSVQKERERPKYLQRGRVSISNTTSVLPTTL